jgi:hypothetical protein
MHFQFLAKFDGKESGGTDILKSFESLRSRPWL